MDYLAERQIIDLTPRSSNFIQRNLFNYAILLMVCKCCIIDQKIDSTDQNLCNSCLKVSEFSLCSTAVHSNWVEQAKFANLQHQCQNMVAKPRLSCSAWRTTICVNNITRNHTQGKFQFMRAFIFLSYGSTWHDKRNNACHVLSEFHANIHLSSRLLLS